MQEVEPATQPFQTGVREARVGGAFPFELENEVWNVANDRPSRCLLYTSDAADEHRDV